MSKNQQKSTKLQVILVGSHADVLKKEEKDADQILSEIFTDISNSFYDEFPETSVEMFGYVALNCRLTKSQGLQKIKAQLKQVQLSSLSDAPQLTAGASLLLGTLEKDFKGKVACQVKDIIGHIKSHKLYIPPEAEQLHSYLKELHACGLVLLLECTSPREDGWIVLDLPLFLSTVHKKLFSDQLSPYKDSLSNLGIIPIARLQAMFPEFSPALLKGCLTLLQYCQEINDPKIISKVLEISTVESTSKESVLFLPALLQTSREEVKWICSHSSMCCIGWCAECFRTYDFFHKAKQAKSEFCNVLKAKCYIVSPDNLKQSSIPEADQLQLFETRNIQEVLLTGSEGAVGRDGKGYLPSSELTCLQTQTSWSEYACVWEGFCILLFLGSVHDSFFNRSPLSHGD